MSFVKKKKCYSQSQPVYYNSIYIEDARERSQSVIIDFFEYTIGTNDIDNGCSITAIDVLRGSCWSRRVGRKREMLNETATRLVRDVGGCFAPAAQTTHLKDEAIDRSSFLTAPFVIICSFCPTFSNTSILSVSSRYK